MIRKVTKALIAAMVLSAPGWSQDETAPVPSNMPAMQAPAGSDMAQAYDFFQKKQYGKAAALYEKVLDQTPNDADAMLGLAWSKLDMGDAYGAKALFEMVLSMTPTNASALEGLKYTPKRDVSLSVGYNYAWIKYSHISFKNRAYSYNIPVTLTYRDLGALSMAYTYTVIHFNPTTSDALQREFNPSGYLNIGKHLTLNAAYDYLMVDDIATDSGKVTTGGFTLHNYDPASDLFLSVGGYESYSDYRPFRILQMTPHVAAGWKKLYTDLYAMYTNIDKTNERLASYGASLSVGPYWGLTPTVSGYAGNKRLPVENWGTTIYNNQDLYRRGWKAGLSYAYKGLTVFASYGIDNVVASVPPLFPVPGFPQFLQRATGDSDTPYTAKTAVLGATYKY